MEEKDLQLRGMRRKIDCVGRIFLPTDVRRDVGICPGDEVEVFVVGDNEGIYIKLLKKAED